MVMTNNIFLIGLNQANLTKLRHIRGADQHAYHGVLDPSEVYDTEVFPIPDMLRRAEAAIRDSGVSVDAIAGYMDFPVSTMLPLLCKTFGTRSTSLESLLKCEHKYWSRVAQREVIPDNIPGFTAFDPFDDEALQTIGAAGLGFPFFVKPVKSSGSRLGFKIDSPEDFEKAIRVLRAEINLIAEPFDYVLEHATLPDAIKKVSGHYCMAESIIGGHQCTVEGYVHNGEVVPYGIVDSIRYPQVLSFFHYLYPSGLPAHVQTRMRELTVRIMRHVGFDNSAFNIEFFWDEPRDHVWLLEINTRISQSHCDLFEKVDGVSHHQVTIDLALGRKPDMPHREGAYPVAAKFFHRVFFKDATVARVPTKDEIEAVQTDVPGCIVALQVREGQRLSELPEQDSYSFAVAYIWLGARDHESLLRTYETVLGRLNFAYTDIEE
jgi:hypothetical protein